MRESIRVLIVENEVITAQALESQIEKMGYSSIDIAITYTRAMKFIKSEAPDLILLDIDLKGKYSGIDIATEKEVFNKIPVIYLTALTDRETITKILATNPKSYISKPIRYEDLEIAISLALGHKTGLVDIGYGFSYDLGNRDLFVDKTMIRLSQKEKSLLEALLERQGEIIQCKELELKIWGSAIKSESSLRTLVRSLRKKLNPKMILNSVSFGYKLDISEDTI